MPFLNVAQIGLGAGAVVLRLHQQREIRQEICFELLDPDDFLVVTRNGIVQHWLGKRFQLLQR